MFAFGRAFDYPSLSELGSDGRDGMQFSLKGYVVIGVACCGFVSGPAGADILTPVAGYVDGTNTGTGLTGINNAGWTTGSINYADGSALGFARDPAGAHTTFSYGFQTNGRAIGNANQVIGYTSIANGGALNFQEFSRSASGVGTILTNPTGGAPLHGIAQGVNDSGALVGNYRGPIAGASRIVNHGFILDAGVLTDLSTPGQPFYSTNARGISNDGTMVGLTSIR